MNGKRRSGQGGNYPPPPKKNKKNQLYNIEKEPFIQCTCIHLICAKSMEIEENASSVRSQ